MTPEATPQPDIPQAGTLAQPTPPAETPKPKSNKKLLILVVILFVVILGALAVVLLLPKENKQPPKPANSSEEEKPEASEHDKITDKDTLEDLTIKTNQVISRGTDTSYSQHLRVMLDATVDS